MDDIYDPVSDHTLQGAAKNLMYSRRALTIFNGANWNMDGSHRSVIVDSETGGEEDSPYHSEFFVVLPGLAYDFWRELVPIAWEVRDQNMRDAYRQATYPHAKPGHGAVWSEMSASEKNPIVLTVYYISELDDWKDGEGHLMKKVVGLKPAQVLFHTPYPMHGYIAARRFNAVIEAAVSVLKTDWLDGLYFKVSDSHRLGLNDKEDFNYVAEMTDYTNQSDAIMMMLVAPDELRPKLDTSKLLPDITPDEERIVELETMFESYMRAHPDAPKEYMTISIMIGLSDEYYALLARFGQL